MIGYFGRLRFSKLVLWCYLAWYLAMVVLYFEPLPSLWLSSIGIAAIIGFALNLAAQQSDRKTDRWVIFRLYLFPFCVSSYSALIKGKGFVLLFPPDFRHLMIAGAACLAVLVLHWVCRALLPASGA